VNEVHIFFEVKNIIFINKEATIAGFSLVFSTTGKGPVQTGKALG